ncbi:hypothetical protein PR003_g18716 [Phytophthora rubi]|uniref:RxLR effector protein n=1 Tax=Phytophthora rubi TaxID=129364 RepID=A0A6A3JSW6_9STRA|nr:hypothetical protein PR002_g20234 [Phytophthora rubi]KAE8997971.1 hypothetical protein PR001_g19440 [Phytophthora rubi]KAE9316431.1 hypothetical protein PR003_g18716 [Phytophthora rubi]
MFVLYTLLPIVIVLTKSTNTTSVRKITCIFNQSLTCPQVIPLKVACRENWRYPLENDRTLAKSLEV